MVWCHGGPTSSCQAGLDLTLQFFTTRGFAVACVDYAGSSGYGRDYRNALWGRWGVADAEDCLDAALHLAGRGDVDARRLAIRGGSAGGMTALNALASGEGFGACASWYGVTDLLGLVDTTHDFEAHYTDRLIGPLPEALTLYVERSPVARAAAMAGSVLLLQGTDDAVVPPSRPSACWPRWNPPACRATCASSRGRGTDSAGPTPSPHVWRRNWGSIWRSSGL